MTRLISLLLALVCLLACGSREPARRYPIEGEVKALDAQSKTAAVAAGKIDGWMEAMTMEYPVKPETEFAKLHVGDKLTGIVVVTGGQYYLTGIKVTAKQ